MLKPIFTGGCLHVQPGGANEPNDLCSPDQEFYIEPLMVQCFGSKSGRIPKTEILRACNKAQQLTNNIMLGTMPGMRRQGGRIKQWLGNIT